MSTNTPASFGTRRIKSNTTKSLLNKIEVNNIFAEKGTDKEVKKTDTKSSFSCPIGNKTGPVRKKIALNFFFIDYRHILLILFFKIFF